MCVCVHVVGVQNMATFIIQTDWLGHIQKVEFMFDSTQRAHTSNSILMVVLVFDRSLALSHFRLNKHCAEFRCTTTKLSLYSMNSHYNSIMISFWSAFLYFSSLFFCCCFAVQFSLTLAIVKTLKNGNSRDITEKNSKMKMEMKMKMKMIIKKKEKKN